jgi:DNA-binding PadR family transcriptional regulator
MKEDKSPPLPMIMKTLICKGDFKVIVLSVLQDRPMHGYEITRVIQEESHGMYRPSAGAVYPALKILLKKGMVKVTSSERRKVYRITPAGKKLLRERHAELHSYMEAFKKSLGPEKAAMMEEMAKTGKLIAATGRTITPAQAKKVAKIVAETRERILRILSE